jgi:hypothetical protein
MRFPLACHGEPVEARLTLVNDAFDRLRLTNYVDSLNYFLLAFFLPTNNNVTIFLDEKSKTKAVMLGLSKCSPEPVEVQP